MTFSSDQVSVCVLKQRISDPHSVLCKYHVTSNDKRMMPSHWSRPRQGGMVAEIPSQLEQNMHKKVRISASSAQGL